MRLKYYDNDETLDRTLPENQTRNTRHNKGINSLFKDSYMYYTNDEIKNQEAEMEYLNLISVDGNKQLTYTEAMQSAEWPHYQEAIKRELEAMDITKHGMQQMKFLKIENQSDTHGHFSKKQNEVPIRYKARLCAQGYSQIHGLDYFEAYSLVITQTTMRMIISIAAAENMYLHKMEVSTAFQMET